MQQKCIPENIYSKTYTVKHIRENIYRKRHLRVKTLQENNPLKKILKGDSKVSGPLTKK